MSEGSSNTETAVVMSKYAKSPPIKFLVGAKSQEFYVHRSLLAAKTEGFDSTLIASRAETGLQLPSVQPEVFDHFIDCLYHGDISQPINDMDLVDLYNLGCQYEYLELRNRALEQLWES